MREARNRFLNDVFRTWVGPRLSWRFRADAMSMSRDFPARITDALTRLSPAARAHGAQPVFVFSAGWRSGSTMLQRMIMENNPELLIWGEPFDLTNLHDHMAAQFRA